MKQNANGDKNGGVLGSKVDSQHQKRDAAIVFDISPMEHDDIPSVQDIARITWKDTYGGIFDENAQESVLSHAYSFESLDESMRLHQAFLVARVVPSEKSQKAPLAGYIDMGLKGRDVTLYRLYILPQYQRSGLGRRLFETALRKVLGSLPRDTPRPIRVIAQVERDNQRARAFYRKLGFAEIREETVRIGGIALPIIEIQKELIGGP